MAKFPLAFGALSALAAAQTPLVLPPSHAVREGSSATNVPFGRSTAMRCQFVYDGALFPRAGSVERLALRLDGGATAATKQVELEVRAATGPASILGTQTAFAANLGGDARAVVSRRVLDLPPLGSGQTPNPFHAAIPFDAPFAYDPRQGAWVCDFTVFGQPPGEYPLDLTYVCDSPLVRYGPAGCGTVGGQPLHVRAATTQVMWGQPFDLQVAAAVPSSTAGVFLGTLEQGMWAGITLPFDLAPLGAAGCSLSIDVLALAFAPANTSGVATLPFALPARPDLVGAVLRFQGFDLAPGVNALGVLTSQPARLTVCGWERVARVWAPGASATVGVREVGLAPPVEVGWR